MVRAVRRGLQTARDVAARMNVKGAEQGRQRGKYQKTGVSDAARHISAC